MTIFPPKCDGKMLHTEGLVLKTIKYGETSLIVHLYTRDVGLFRGIIGGVRTPRAGSRRAIAQVMNWVQMTCYYSERPVLHRIKDVHFSYVYQYLPFDPVRRAIGIFMVDVLNRVLTEGDHHQSLYDFIRKTFIHLDTAKAVAPEYPLQFLVRLTKYLGIQPSLESQGRYFDLRDGVFVDERPSHEAYLREAEVELFRALLEGDGGRKFSKAERRWLYEMLMDYYSMHVPHFQRPKSVVILRQILE